MPHKFTVPKLKCAGIGLLCCSALLLTVGALCADTFARVTAVSVDACGLGVARVQAFTALIHVCGRERRGQLESQQATRSQESHHAHWPLQSLPSSQLRTVVLHMEGVI